ncbi:hypothetical protein Tco_0747879 [Tanacetum coccineum]|uniref:Uncharacterized protein n=1 Tax=Tanacetum coccineum TaxID=301880 RepID=A0ABQ4YXG3_9ASTR
MVRDFSNLAVLLGGKKLCEETSGEIIPSRDGSRGTIKVNGIYNSEKFLKMLDRVFEHKSLECTSILHQPDGVGSQGGHLGSFGKLNGVLVALVARSGDLGAEYFGAGAKLMGLQLLQLELRLGKTPSRSFRPVNLGEILWQFWASSSFGVSLAHDGSWSKWEASLWLCG